jgi:hypothetical protein
LPAWNLASAIPQKSRYRCKNSERMDLPGPPSGKFHGAAGAFRRGKREGQNLPRDRQELPRGPAGIAGQDQEIGRILADWFSSEAALARAVPHDFPPPRAGVRGDRAKRGRNGPVDHFEPRTPRAWASGRRCRRLRRRRGWQWCLRISTALSQRTSRHPLRRVPLRAPRHLPRRRGGKRAQAPELSNRRFRTNIPAISAPKVPRA